jgi:hypothetical protein
MAYFIGAFSIFLLAIFVNLYVAYMSMALFGVAVTLVYLGMLRNAWRYFPTRKGLINGLLFSSYACSSLIFTAFADLIINPESKVPNEFGIYPKEVSDLMHKFILFLLICFSSVGILTTFLIFPYKPEGEVIYNEELFPESILDPKRGLLPQTTDKDLEKRTVTSEPV